MPIAITLLKKFWLEIVLTAVLSVSVYGIWNNGKKSGTAQGFIEGQKEASTRVTKERDQFWKSEIDKSNALYEAQISSINYKLEQSSVQIDKERALRLQQRKEFDKRILELAPQINTVVGDDGAECKNAVLGVEFINIWNTQNELWTTK